MLKKSLSSLLLLLTFLLQAEQSTDTTAKPTERKHEGSHGMVLMAAGSTLYASLMPQYAKPHDVQLVYSVSAENPAVVYLTKDAELVTIRPEPFNLQRLLRGESVTLKADIYLGHYRRGGMLTHPNQEITFDEQLYKRSLKDLPKPDKVQIYDQIVLRDDRILIHQIQKAPSYDHLVLVQGGNSCFTEFKMRDAVPDESELLRRLSFCGPLKSLYYDAAKYK